MSTSILILTLNEEANLPACLESARWSDDIVVLDSFSEDDTVEIAHRAGARVFQREFDDFAGQRNYAIDHIEFRYPWVFHLDADERFTPELVEECRQVAAQDRHSGYLVPSKMMLWGKWLRHAANYPVYQMRLMKLGEIRFIQYGHGQREFAAERGVGKLRAPYEHYSYSKGFDEWIDRHNRYSSEEAVHCLQELRSGSMPWRCLLARDSTRRRRALKQLSLRLPMRPWLRFAYSYFLHLGFLDGAAGLTYCSLKAMYEQMICLKVKELRQREIAAEHGALRPEEEAAPLFQGARLEAEDEAQRT